MRDPEKDKMLANATYLLNLFTDVSTVNMKKLAPFVSAVWRS